MKKIFIITGEHSGDIHGANVVRKLKHIDSDIIVEGVGAANMEQAGVKLFHNHDDMAAVGLSPKILFNHIMLGRRIVNYLKNEYKPDLVLLIDYGAFNLSMAKCLKGSGIKVYYYIPPQIWASRKYRIKLIKKYVDKVLCIFPFEPDMYEVEGISTHYCGHPLIAQLPQAQSRIEFFKELGFDPDRRLVSIFPGSRIFELKQLAKPFLKAAKELQHKHPNLQFCIAQAPNLKDEVFNKYFKKCDFKIVKNNNYGLLSTSDALILASGTVALEACLYKTPMIIAYRGPKLFYWIYLLVRCIKRVSLPNIIADKSIVPEILQDELTSHNIANHIENLLYDTEIREKQISELAQVRELLSDKNSAFEVAKEIDKALSECS